ncbi:MAG: RNHCP domain-containing protein, partial [Clostridia bacterium]|nr:RNHCP domain-containing protein [Clostridia bacterium]
MKTQKFTKNDNEFVCENCGKKVEKLGYTSRDHCNYCLCSKHVDINPGDRLDDCHGLLEPIDVEINSKKGMVIVYKCKKCNAIKRNILAEDDD